MEGNTRTPKSVPNLKSAAAPAPRVAQLVRNIGAIDSPDTMAVGKVNAELAHMLGQGWKIHTARTVGVLPGGVSVYYLLIKA